MLQTGCCVLPTSFASLRTPLPFSLRAVLGRKILATGLIFFAPQGMLTGRLSPHGLCSLACQHSHCPCMPGAQLPKGPRAAQGERKEGKSPLGGSEQRERGRSCGAPPFVLHAMH